MLVRKTTMIRGDVKAGQIRTGVYNTKPTKRADHRSAHHNGYLMDSCKVDYRYNRSPFLSEDVAMRSAIDWMGTLSDFSVVIRSCKLYSRYRQCGNNPAPRMSVRTTVHLLFLPTSVFWLPLGITAFLTVNAERGIPGLRSWSHLDKSKNGSFVILFYHTH